MKKIIILLFSVIVSFFNFSCSSQLYLQKRTSRIIEKSYKNTDTVYLYSVAFNDFNIVWYNKDNFIYSFRVKPFNAKKYKPIDAKNISINNDSINKYFDNFLFKDIQCFESVLDGEIIKIYVKNKRPLLTSINTDCLFKRKFEQNSFPYKLQYDLSKLLKKSNDFEKIYTEIK